MCACVCFLVYVFVCFCCVFVVCIFVVCLLCVYLLCVCVWDMLWCTSSLYVLIPGSDVALE